MPKKREKTHYMKITIKKRGRENHSLKTVVTKLEILCKKKNEKYIKKLRYWMNVLPTD